ncbi:protein yippee-like [Populus alba x Populus x berolinensis]|uniref:Protein yippee-like n=1 Tax=Populus alba x Populus x berolinensis TaxID=444605 RepID=A0AAD6LM20_9ROSI|nr:protein yippee-like [Populus alba x Populus x berolinensis]
MGLDVSCPWAQKYLPPISQILLAFVVFNEQKLHTESHNFSYSSQPSSFSSFPKKLLYFCSRNRRAYLFYNVENVTYGPREDRMMITGKHTVADIFCVVCGSILGWKYIHAYVKAHKYKEGWFVIERCKVLNPAGTPYEANQEAQVGQQAPNGQETWMAQEAQAGGGIDVDNA